MNHITDNHEALLDYLYEEGDPAERLRVATHLQECAACAVAVLEFQNVRGMLSDWAPPASLLGFRMVQDAGASPSALATSPSATVDQGARGGWWRGWGPATHQEKWGPATHQEKWDPTTTKESSRAWAAATTRTFLQAAAGILLFVSGMAVSQLNVEYRDGVVTVGRQPAVPEAPPGNFGGTSITLYPENPSAEPLGGPGGSDSDENERARLLERVRAMIDQSEQRQQRELALRLSQVSREVDTQHKADLLQIQQDFGQQQDATMEYLVKTSGGVK